MFFLVSFFFQLFFKACLPSPTLNKAFVIGPGYAQVTYKLFSKITAGLFLDLAGLLPDNIRTQEIEPQAFLEGKLVVSGSKKRVIDRQISSPG